MNRVLIGVVLLSTFPLFIGGTRSYAQETPPEVRDYDLSRLELSPERRGQVATAFRRKDYKKAEEILVAAPEFAFLTPAEMALLAARLSTNKLQFVLNDGINELWRLSS